MKSIPTAALVLFLSIPAFFVQAQDRPEFPELKVKEDYAKSEAVFQQVTEWITETDPDTQEELHTRSNAFIMKWAMGSPTVNLVIGDHLMRLFARNPQLAIIYMANYASFCISNKENKSTVEPTKAGLQAAVKVYKKGKGVKKNKEFDKLVLAADKNELDNYITENMKDEPKAH